MDGNLPGSIVATRRYAFICNGRAGSAPQRQSLDHLARQLRQSGHEVQLYDCRLSPELTATAAIREGYNAIVAVGGDGTVSACASAVWKAGELAVLGLIPAGTLNHFSKDLGISTFEIAEAALTGGAVRNLDIASVNGLSFVNNASIGLYPVIVRKREFSRRAGIPRWTAFFLATIRALSRFPVRRLGLEVDGHFLKHRTPFLLVGNNVYRVEGIRIGTRANLEGGVLGICASGAAGFLALLRLVLHALTGRIGQEKDFLNITAEMLTVRSPHSALQVALDGELRRLRTPLKFQIHRRALPVLVPNL